MIVATIDAGLVSRRRKEGNIIYSLADPTVLRICQLFCARAEEDARTELAEVIGSRPRKRESRSSRDGQSPAA